MACTASPPPSREQRTLATLDQEAAANDPVRQAQAKIHDLDQLAIRVATSAERAAVDDALRAARVELRQARREQHIDDVFARYGGSAHDDAMRATPSHRRLRRPHRPTRLGRRTPATTARRRPPRRYPDRCSGYPDRGRRGAPRPARVTSPTAGPSSGCVQPPARYPSSRSRYPGRDPGSQSGGDP